MQKTLFYFDNKGVAKCLKFKVVFQYMIKIQYCHSSKATSHEFHHKTPKDNLATIIPAYGVTKMRNIGKPG